MACKTWYNSTNGTAIVDQTGTVVTTYLYDAWGNHLHTTGSLSATVGRYNPLRYRGYVYDRETKLYYLQSRYYNPETGRFINGDRFTTTGQGIIGNNMFAYCGNNPLRYTDTYGTRYEEYAGGGGGGIGICIGIGLGGGGGSVGGGGSATIGASYYGYTNVANYSGGVGTAVAVFPTSTISEYSVLRREQIDRRRNETSITSEEIETTFKAQLASSMLNVPNREDKHIHHIVAQTATKAGPAREILGKVGIDVNNPQNLVPVRASVRQRLHNNWYYLAVNVRIGAAYASAGNNRVLQYIRVSEVLLHYQIMLGAL